MGLFNIYPEAYQVVKIKGFRRGIIVAARPKEGAMAAYERFCASHYKDTV